MTKVLFQTIENLPAETQSELLEYIEFLSKAKKGSSKRMTMDRFQQKKIEMSKNFEEQSSHVHYTIW